MNMSVSKASDFSPLLTRVSIIDLLFSNEKEARELLPLYLRVFRLIAPVARFVIRLIPGLYSAIERKGIGIAHRLLDNLNELEQSLNIMPPEKCESLWPVFNRWALRYKYILSESERNNESVFFMLFEQITEKLERIATTLDVYAIPGMRDSVTDRSLHEGTIDWDPDRYR